MQSMLSVPAIRRLAAHVDGMPFDCVWLNTRLAHDVLKMNIEGAERLALPGCRRALEHTRHVCIAAHDFRADRGEKEWYRTGHFVRQALTEAGFHVTPRDDARPWARDHIHGVRPAQEIPVTAPD